MFGELERMDKAARAADDLPSETPVLDAPREYPPPDQQNLYPKP